MFHQPFKELRGLYSLSITSLKFRWHEDRQPRCKRKDLSASIWTWACCSRKF